MSFSILIAVMLVCNIASAITIQYTIIDPIDALGDPILGTPGGGFNPNDPLVELIGPNGPAVARQSSMGMNAGPNMCVDAHTDNGLVGGEAYFIRVYNGTAVTATHYGDSPVFYVEQDSQTSAPLDTFPVFNGIQTMTAIPEPSLMLSGLALLLLRKRS